jgi:hypothetical protein
MLETFGLHTGAKSIDSAFERIFGATIFFGTESQTAKAKVVYVARFNFLREAQIWYNRQPDQGIPVGTIRERHRSQRRVLSGDHGSSYSCGFGGDETLVRLARCHGPFPLAMLPLS